MASHELRTPVGVLGGCLQIARQCEDTDAERRDRALAQAERNYHRIVEMLTDMSEVWSLESGQALFNRRATPLAHVLDEVVKAARGKLSRDVLVSLETPSVGELTLNIDSLRVVKALTCLVASVGRHAPEGRLGIHAGILNAAPARVELRFSPALADAGTGCQTKGGERTEGREPPDEFETGLGLGLAIALRVIHAEGGTVFAVAAPDRRQLVAELPVPT